MQTRGLWFLLLACLARLASAETPLRIEHLVRCGDLLDHSHQRFCLCAHGLDDQPLHVRFGGQMLTAERQGQGLQFEAQPGQHSGPLLLAQGGRFSNPVWLSLADNHVVAARPGETAQNMDGLSTYVNLVSVIIDAQGEGLQQAQALARKYSASVVAAIPVLNTYQLRLPTRDLTERDALVLRLGSETGVAAVVIEEGAAVEQAPPAPGPAPGEDEWASNRFADALNYYRRRIPARGAPLETVPVKVGVIERSVDFDSPDFAEYLGACELPRTCVYARDAAQASQHGSSVVGVLAAHWQKGGNTGLLRGLDGASKGFEVIVDRDSDAGVLANVAASVNLVEDGARVLNWSWGLNRIGAKAVQGGDVDSEVHSGLAMKGYEALLEAFFRWLRQNHPDVVVVNSAGNGGASADSDEYRLPSSLVTDQLLVVGGHQRSDQADMAVGAPGYAVKRASSNIGLRVDISAAACTHGATDANGEAGTVHCGTSFATPMVSGTVAAMLSINPALTPEQLRILLRRSALPIGGNYDFDSVGAENLTAPILPSERNFDLNHPDVGRSARLDIQKAFDLAVQSRDRRR
ncbi:S8/S53 family peptidase [Pseudomonas typographi]|uniref:S8/S53 family peptidase n=1 Tax=Pseudomonas typographi TaxID=2715964 RepID=A0ABR7Z276_9PSED|nr:S8/S53 family peptidase [Pseudomonas typographi]MBD1599547.1 S8/S53 family peptidase [Pseudomonas typographi]